MQRAFESSPSQFTYISRSLASIRLRASHGFRAGWDAPFAVWYAPEGLDTAYPASRHATVTCLHHSSLLARVDKAGRRASGGAGFGELIMYGGGYDRQYFCATDASCDQIYLTQEMIAECGQEVFGVERVELREDRLFIKDVVLRRSVQAYVQRGLDTSLAPTRLEMNARAVMIALHLVTHYSNCSLAQKRGQTGLGRRKLDAVLERIEANLDGSFRIADLAEEAGLGISQFFASFRASVGKTPHAYLVERRLDKAKALLRGKDSLSAIAIDCGFGSQQHFSTAFRSEIGTSPGAWRKAVLDPLHREGAVDNHASD